MPVEIGLAGAIERRYTAADFAERWGLGSEFAWDLDISRAPCPANEGFHGVEEFENPECHWFWCVFVWRSPVADEAANYEHEALWVVLYREYPDEWPG